LNAEEDSVPNIQLQRRMSVPAELAADALAAILKAIADQDGPWRGFALHVGLGELRLPDVGYVAVPIHLQFSKSAAANAFEIRFSSVNLPSAFPVFTGTLSLASGELGESSLQLNGTYELPFQVFGKFLDGALMPHIATKSLENFLDEIAAACQARVDRREAEYARYRYYTHA
jgi:hypothetical protein